MIGRNPNPPPSRNLFLSTPRQPMSLSQGTSSLSEHLAAPGSRLPAAEGTISTLLPRHPPWAPPRRHPRRRRSKLKSRMTTTASPPQYPQGSQSIYQEHRQNNSGSDLAPEKRRKISFHIPSGSTTSSTPSTAAAERERKFTCSIRPSQPNTAPCNSNEAFEGLSQEEAAEEQLDSDSPCSSPLREPHAPLVPIWISKSGKVYDGLTNDREALDAYREACHKYRMKQGSSHFIRY
ncbi:hypothetical protein PR202_gb11261 [Eleusine coracana subsp. coracana]|uniref:Uncharacterized protein n=1 Tax=Eleusine coracana subsp. coracana TaxID=191504 RepID=A0AAV5ELB8_ELECO|nr:hypothetical protein PR202_gb11261 [Eleusine coracana subsp. coracana]